MDIRKISDALSVASQISADDVATIKAAGFVAIVNNRPDGEVADQPWNDDIEEAADRLGMPYHYLPVINAPYAPKMIEMTRLILETYSGPVLFFCRSGTRATYLWAFSQIGIIPEAELISLAAAAGYDLSSLTGHLS